SSTHLVQDKFVIAMVDPDAPTPQNNSLAQIRHFVGGDFIISSAASNGTARLTNTSAAIAEYISPGPPAGSDPHRYTILLFKQPENFSVAASTLIQPNSSFEGFNISAFASSVGLGNPIAGTYFLEGPAGSTVT
ncbi:PEBP-like protein, partial [Gymnopus androsaceus JB14]